MIDEAECGSEILTGPGSAGAVASCGSHGSASKQIGDGLFDDRGVGGIQAFTGNVAPCGLQNAQFSPWDLRCLLCYAGLGRRGHPGEATRTAADAGSQPAGVAIRSDSRGRRARSLLCEDGFAGDPDRLDTGI
ncbi:hypothetical protein Brsp05_04512 [Brucella sp. NBRC 12953]